MPRRTSGFEPKKAVLNAEQMKLGIQRLEKLIEQIKGFDTRIIQKRWGPEVKALETAIEGALASVFGNNTFEYNRYIDAADLDKGPVTMEPDSTWASAGRYSNMPNQYAHEAQQYVSEGKERSIQLLQEAIKWLHDELEFQSGQSVISEEAKMSNHSPSRLLNPKSVFVIHGRQLLNEFHSFLRALGLAPLEWSRARSLTGKPTPYTWEIVDKALSEAGAIVALLTPDDEARLRPDLCLENENSLEKQYLSQPRQNVLFEAGVAYGRAPERTVLIRVGSHRPISDLAGHHILQLDDSPQSRQAVADALRAAGCLVDTSGSDWYRSGSFSLPEMVASQPIDQIKKDLATLSFHKIQLKGFSDLFSAAEVVVKIHKFYELHPEYLNSISAAFLIKYPVDFRDHVAYDADNASKRWSLDELKHDVDTLEIAP
jgi:predicted nucleotide-binding protein